MKYWNSHSFGLVILTIFLPVVHGSKCPTWLIGFGWNHGKVISGVGNMLWQRIIADISERYVMMRFRSWIFIITYIMRRFEFEISIIDFKKMKHGNIGAHAQGNVGSNIRIMNCLWLNSQICQSTDSCPNDGHKRNFPMIWTRRLTF